MHIHILGQNLVFLNSREAASDLLDKRGLIYSDKPSFVMVGELWVPFVSFFATMYSTCYQPSDRCGCQNMVNAHYFYTYRLQNWLAPFFSFSLSSLLDPFRSYCHHYELFRWRSQGMATKQTVNVESPTRLSVPQLFRHIIPFWQREPANSSNALSRTQQIMLSMRGGTQAILPSLLYTAMRWFQTKTSL